MQAAIENKEHETPTAEKQSEGVIVEMQHLEKSFGENHVLKDINLKIKPPIFFV